MAKGTLASIIIPALLSLIVVSQMASDLSSPRHTPPCRALTSRLPSIPSHSFYPSILDLSSGHRLAPISCSESGSIPPISAHFS